MTIRFTAMSVTTTFMIALLAASILSYGIPASVAQVNPCPDGHVTQGGGECEPAFSDDKTSPGLTVETDQTFYADGATITLTGKINTTSDITNDVTVVIRNPGGAIIGIEQIKPFSDGSFEAEFQASGKNWNAGGEYEITTNYGALYESKINFEFGGSGDAIPPLLVCDAGEKPVNGVCVPDIPPPPPPVCDAGEKPVNGVCVPDEPEPECGPGTAPDKDGVCQVVQQDPPPTTDGGDGGTCLIATAAYGSELAPQVQFLREVRDGTLYSTAAGTSFMTGFNQFYYSFSPTIADWERESPIFKEAVRATITPMISSLGIMTLADQGSEAEVLGYGISVIALNLGMYVAAPVGAVFGIRKYLASRS